MKDYRPDPDALLAAIQKDESREKRGKLKIFFGMAAGVGKTYTMLQAAHQLQAAGADVVVGYIETHKRAETAQLLQGLEVIPRQQVSYRGATLEEMDTDAILARNPDIVLVDELAHTNVPGVRHVKRYQDVQELLAAGIDVYTTVNVQHFESRADAVRQITGVTVQETLPDSILDLADEIELIDLSPEDLRKRLAEGKVYTAERIQTASDNFFRMGNLTALREMALRLTAERVDHQLQDYMSLKQIAGPWKSGERLLVAVGPSPFSEQLIRWTRRMAYNLEAPWIAAYVETPDQLSPKQKQRLAENLALARSLGGEVVMTSHSNVSEGLLRLARQRNISQIVVGKPLQPPLFDLLPGTSPVNHLIRNSGDIDIYVVTGTKRTADTVTQLAEPDPKEWRRYAVALAATAVVIGLSLAALPWIGDQAVGLLALLVVLLIAVNLGQGPALLAAVLSALSWDYLFIEPRFTFSISSFEDGIMFGMYFAIAIFAGRLAARLRTQERQARGYADRTMALYALAREIAGAVDMDEVLKVAVTQIQYVFNTQVAVLLAHDDGLHYEPHICSTLSVDEKEYSVARWAFENGQPAGRFTDTLPLASLQFVPLKTPSRTLGVIGIRTPDDAPLAFDQEALLETFINQIALVIERELLDEAAQQAATLKESQRLYTTLLNSVSSELHAPIMAINGAAEELAGLQNAAAEHDHLWLTRSIQASSRQLDRLVENLLDMARLEGGTLTLRRGLHPARTLINSAAKRLEHALEGRSLIVDVPADMPPLPVDNQTLEQVLVNLLDNACQYSPPGTPVRISARQAGAWAEIAVRDFGQGIPEEECEIVFDKFFRKPGAGGNGTGLGLSVSRGLVEAHGGTLTAHNAEGGGAELVIRLPLEAAPVPA